MTISILFPSLPRLARCRRVTDVAGVAIDGMRTAFGSHVGTAFFLDDALQASQLALFGARDADVEEYHQTWRGADLVLSAALARLTPIHNWQVYREDAPPPLYTQFGRRLDTYHYMSVPLFGSSGTVAGFLNICRRARQQTFGEADIRLASIFAGFLSATLVRVTENKSCTPDEVATDILATRELQVARLAAAGRNNLEIALQLGVARETVKQTLRRVYRKLEARGRAHMAAKLASYGLL